MPPHSPAVRVINNEDNLSESYLKRDEEIEDLEFKPKGYFKTDIIWPNAIGLGALYIITAYTLLTYPFATKYGCFLYLLFTGTIAGLGLTVGVHRALCHRSYKVKTPLKIFLLFLSSISGQNSVYCWVRDHRLHHKYCDTAGDPYDASRGFLFAHVGWLAMKKHPEVLRKGRGIDMTDITSDPIVMFHEKYFWFFKTMCCFIIPMAIPCIFWGESLYFSIMLNLTRYHLSMNGTWFVNSFAHMYGDQPYDKNITPTENLFVGIVAHGEGWHNYHHTFPWDYKTSERGRVNLSTLCIDTFAKFGWAYDLKEPSPALLKKVIRRCGDGTHRWGKEVPEDESEIEDSAGKTL